MKKKFDRPPAKPSLWEEVKRGWEWVVFVSKLVPRIGGIQAWIRTLFFIVSLMIARLMEQRKSHKMASSKSKR